MNYMLDAEINIFWTNIQYFLSELNVEINKSVDGVISKISYNSNESFPLNGYLSLARSIDGKELAIVINVHLMGDKLHITSDACMEDGRIIAEGPSLQLAARKFSMKNMMISSWLHEFSLFLDKEKKIITEELLYEK